MLLKKLRLKLGLYFAALVLILYEIGVMGALALFSYSLHHSMDGFLADLLSEIRPSVQIEKSEPSLQKWADAARLEHSPILATAQVFDNKSAMIQCFGPPGVAQLYIGELKVPDKALSVRSMYQPIIHEGRRLGFIQVQVSTEPIDRSLRQMLIATHMVLPLLVLGVALSGFFFSGVALRPVELVLGLWRRFIADAGHELKTPVAVIEAGVETLKQVHREHGISELELELVEQASKRMKVLISDLLMLSKVEEPDQVFPLEKFDFSQLVSAVLQDYKGLAQEKRVELNLESEASLEIYARKELLRQLVGNLLANAICYTNEGGRVSVSLSKVGKQISLRVSDTGIGIGSADLSHIFDRFYRVESSRSRDAGGAGLGLSIVKAVVDAHKGTIAVESKPSEGSTFTVLLPQARES